MEHPPKTVELKVEETLNASTQALTCTVGRSFPEPKIKLELRSKVERLQLEETDVNVEDTGAGLVKSSRFLLPVLESSQEVTCAAYSEETGLILGNSSMILSATTATST